MDKRKRISNKVKLDYEFWKNKKVLITGNTGFMGSWLSHLLLELDVKIIGFSNGIPTKPNLFTLTKLENETTWIKGDIKDYEQVEKVLRKYKPEIIIHLAAQSLVTQSYREPLETYFVNVLGTVNLLEAIRKIKSVKVVLNVTSDKSYRSNGKFTRHKENDCMGANDPYSNSKSCSELITDSFRKSFFRDDNEVKHVAIATVRPGNVIGGGDWAKDRLIPNIIRSCFNNKKLTIRYPNAVRPWQYVLEPVYAYLILIQKLWYESSYEEAWNLGPSSTESKTVRWIVEQFSKNLSKYNMKYSFIKPQIYEEEILALDSTKARKKLGWRTKIDLETTIKLTAKWYDAYYQQKDMKKICKKEIEKFLELV